MNDYYGDDQIIQMFINHDYSNGKIADKTESITIDAVVNLLCSNKNSNNNNKRLFINDILTYCTYVIIVKFHLNDR